MTTLPMTMRWRIVLPVVALALLLAASPQIADAALAPVSETIISTHRVASLPSPRTEVRSALTFASASSWRTDVDHALLTLVVTQGMLEVQLAAGAARIERDAFWLADTGRETLVPGTAATLFVGDRLVVVRGYLLTVTNRTDGSATAVMHRVEQP